MSEQDARQRADHLISQLIQYQPQLFTAQVPNETQGTKVADFIAGLRKGLTETFKTQA